MIARLLIALLRGYKKYISPHLGHHCRFIPTCSAKFGYDPVPEKGKWVNPERRLTKDNR